MTHAPPILWSTDDVACLPPALREQRRLRIALRPSAEQQAITHRVSELSAVLRANRLAEWICLTKPYQASTGTNWHKDRRAGQPAVAAAHQARQCDATQRAALIDLQLLQYAKCVIETLKDVLVVLDGFTAHVDTKPLLINPRLILATHIGHRDPLL